MTTYEGPALESVAGIGDLTLAAFIAEVGAAFGPNEALVFDDPLLGGDTVRWSYAQLGQAVDGVAAALIGRGVAVGDRVGIVMGNRPEAVAAIFGIARAGGVAVPLSTFSTAIELRDLLARSGVVGVLTQSTLVGNQLGAHIAALTGQPDVPKLGWSVAVGTPGWSEFIEQGEAFADAVGPRAAAVEPDDEGLVLFSSGTTSTPKGVVHRHRSPTLQFWLQADVFRRAGDSRVWAPLPLFWTAGLTTALGPTLARGGCFVLQEVFDVAAALRLIERERVTEPYTLPHQAAAMAEHADWDGADLASLREVYGKSVFSRHPSVDGDPTWNMPVGYGMSETCSSVATHRWDTPREVMKASTGQLLPGVRLRVIDPDTAEVLGPGLDGEIVLSGAMAFDRYVGKTRAESFDADGFFRTGDVGFVDAEGALHWTGRRTEMIKTAGANVSPAELEVVLRACPAVRRARVVGLPDERLGEVVTLCVERAEGSTATEADLQAFLAERVAKYKVPRHVLFFASGEIPTTGSDTKVRDDELIALALERLAGP